MGALQLHSPQQQSERKQETHPGFRTRSGNLRKIKRQTTQRLITEVRKWQQSLLFFFFFFAKRLILLLRFPLHVNEGVMLFCNQRGRRCSAQSVCECVIDAGLITTKKNNQAVEFKRDWFCSLSLLAWGKKKKVTLRLLACERRRATWEKATHQTEETANLQGPWRNATQRFRWCGAERRTAGVKWTGDPGMTPEDPNTPVTFVSKFAAPSAPCMASVSLLIGSAWASSF